MLERIVPKVALLTALLSLSSWTYRFVAEHVRFEEVLFYVLVPLVTWLLFVGPLYLLLSQKKSLRMLAIVLLIPTTALWMLSILVGIYGLKIH